MIKSLYKFSFLWKIFYTIVENKNQWSALFKDTPKTLLFYFEIMYKPLLQQKILYNVWLYFTMYLEAY